METETLKEAIELRELIAKKMKEVRSCKEYSDNIQNKIQNAERCHLTNTFSGWPKVFLTKEVVEFALTLTEKKLQRQLEELEAEFKNL